MMDQIRVPTACGVILLAAGMGKRMRSAKPKVLHEIGGKPLIFHILSRISEVLPHSSGDVRDDVVAGVQLDAKPRVGQCFSHDAFNF